MPKSTNIPSKTKEVEERKLQILLASYTVAATTRASEAQIQWDRFNAMLLANSIIVVLIGSEDLYCAFSREIEAALIIAGVLLCFLWYQIFNRGDLWTTTWSHMTRDAEEAICSNDKDILKQLPFSKGNTLKKKYCTVMNSHRAGQWIIKAFGFIYLAFALARI